MMKPSRMLQLVLSLSLLVASVSLIYYGTMLVTKGSEERSVASQVLRGDTVQTFQRTTLDTPAQRRTVKSDSIVKTSSVNAPANTAACSICMEELLVKKGYDMIFMGVAMLFVLLALPYLSEISILQIFSAKFREKVEADKAIHNEAVTAVNTNLPPEAPEVAQQPVSEAQRVYAERSYHIPIERSDITVYASDPQKGKWGGQFISNERKLTATVVPLANSSKLFKVSLQVISTNPEKPLKGKVIFHLHPTFPNTDPTIYVLAGAAKMEFLAWGAFTVGAEADNLETKLELDLAMLPEAPLVFRSR